MTTPIKCKTQDKKQAFEELKKINTGYIVLSNGYYYVETGTAFIRSWEQLIAEKYEGKIVKN